MRNAFTILVAVALVGVVVAAYAGGDGKGLEKSVMHGVGWGIGREIAHNVFRHVFH
ncbi:hypothetical protein [Methylocystis sp.]|uniref:hypothetical protein n=1 Tax=Methylocystis sp. TaxID=1911079 RepID=UPI0025F18639|nr:hypothetical protein [Methylocystis sp.]